MELNFQIFTKYFANFVNVSALVAVAQYWRRIIGIDSIYPFVRLSSWFGVPLILSIGRTQAWARLGESPRQNRKSPSFLIFWKRYLLSSLNSENLTETRCFDTRIFVPSPVRCFSTCNFASLSHNPRTRALPTNPLVPGGTQRAANQSNGALVEPFWGWSLLSNRGDFYQPIKLLLIMRHFAPPVHHGDSLSIFCQPPLHNGNRFGIGVHQNKFPSVFCAASPVVPLPAKKSRTVSPGLEYSRTIRPTIASGFWA